MYEPISCEFYDQLQVAIQRKIPSTIVFFNENKEQELRKGLVTTLDVLEYKEFMVLDNKEKIRLDLVISFNGKKYIEL